MGHTNLGGAKTGGGKGLDDMHEEEQHLEQGVELCLMVQLLKRGEQAGTWHPFNMPHLVSRPFQASGGDDPLCHAMKAAGAKQDLLYASPCRLLWPCRQTHGKT